MLSGLIDLHVHTTASDGTLTPSGLVKYAKLKGLSAIAITDHDTIEGLPEALEEANKQEVELVPGVEISVDYHQGEMHILGYYIDIDNRGLAKALSNIRSFRMERNPRIARRLQDLGMDISIEEVIQTAAGNVIGRPHFAALMVKKGYVNSLEEAFDKYLGTNGSAYVAKERLNVEKGIGLIREAGGIPVLAHPKYLAGDSPELLYAIVRNLKKIGLGGIEAYYSSHSTEEILLYSALAKENGLLVTGGTDFHGANKPDIELGIGKGELRIPYELLAEMKKWN